MATTNELLAETTGGALTVNLNSRTIDIPASIKNIGVESDDEVLLLPFHIPRYYFDWDLSEFEIRINYLNAKSEGDVYVITEPSFVDDEETIYFDWLVGRHATAYRGNVTFNICLKKINEDGVVTQEFNTTPCSLPVLPGLETTDAIVQENLDIFEQIMSEMHRREQDMEDRLTALEEGGAGGGGSNVDLSGYVTDEEMKTYVDNEIATFDFIKIVDNLPDEGLVNRIYLVPKVDSQTQDLFDEYIWANGQWEWVTTKQVEVDLTSYVKNTDYPTVDGQTAGVVKIGYSFGIGINAEGQIYLAQASNSVIDKRENQYFVITPNNLEYAVKSVGNEVYATIEEVGNISAALEELHTYAQSLVGGES